MIRPPSIAPTRNDKSAVDERAMDSPDTRAVANARIKMFPVMFAVNTRPSDKKLTASTRPVTTVIPSRAYAMVFSAVGLLVMNNYPTEHIGYCSLRVLPPETCNLHGRPSSDRRFPERVSTLYGLRGHSSLASIAHPPQSRRSSRICNQ